ncbi:hypothetical protein F2Q69_00042358 [Brassica cretica]|uniref:Uncharacterized protein n=1 Tax=Brassica cretica TaxID=69181 RepID=A0A8S9NCS4_BRACR|nr:hypothetical protein F2Q69_00042358 [Brassica cretica]
MSDTQYHGEDISADTYATLRRHQFNLESLGDRLQRMENTTATMKEKWRRGDAAMRDFTGIEFLQTPDRTPASEVLWVRSPGDAPHKVQSEINQNLFRIFFVFYYRAATQLEHATSFTPTKLAPEIYTKDEINEMVTGICGAQEKLGDELKTLHNLEKEATTLPSIDANKATSIEVKPQTSQIPAEPESLAEKKDECEIAYINTGINDVYNPLKNNVDWLSTRIDLLQQDLDTIRKKDPQPATSIDIFTITSIDSKFEAMEDRLQTYEDMHDRFTSPIMRYLDTFSTQMMNVQRDIGKLNDQHDFQEEGSTSINRFRRASLDGKKPT